MEPLSWKFHDTLLLCITKNFIPYENILLCNFEKTIVSTVNRKVICNSIYSQDIPIYHDAFHKKIHNLNGICIVVCDNWFIKNNLTLDTIKTSIQKYHDKWKLPAIYIFATRPNKYSKPYVNMWKFINLLFTTKYSIVPKYTAVVGDAGGRIMTKKRNEVEKISSDVSDEDRAFAHNIGALYFSPHSFVTKIHDKFSYNNLCLPVEDRSRIIKSLYPSPSLMQLFARENNSHCVIMYGAPRSGKSTFCRNLLHELNSSSYGETRVTKILSGTPAKLLSETKKALSTYCNIIIDANLHTQKARACFECIAREYKSRIIYVEIATTTPIAWLFNHVAVETADNSEVMRLPYESYIVYNSTVQRHPAAICYTPVINQTHELMTHRY